MSLFRYKILKLIPRYNQRYISKIIEKEQSLSYNCLKRFNFKNYWPILSVIVIFLFLTSLNILGYLFLIDNINYTDFFKSILIIPLTFIGFIIPVLLLVINNLSTKHPAYNEIYINCCLKPFQTFIILILAFIVNIIFYFYLFISSNPQGLSGNIIVIANFLIIIGLSIILLSSFESIRLIQRTIKSFNDLYLYKSIQKHIFYEIINDVYMERDLNLSRELFQDICKNKSLEAGYLTTWYEHEYKSLKSHRDGFIKDVNIKKINEFGSFLKMKLPNKDALGLVNQIGYRTENKVLGYVHRDEKNTLILKKMLNDAFIIDYEELKDIKSILDALKEASIKSIERNETSQFQRINDVYMGILERYMDCMKKDGIGFNSNWLYSLREPFRFLVLTRHAFKDIAKNASASYNQDLIVEFIFKIYNLSKKAIFNVDYSILKIIIETFQIIYLKCIENDNNLGKGRVLLRLKEIINYLISLWDDKNTDFKKFVSLKFVFYSFLGLLINLSRISIDKKDFESFEKIIEIINSLYLTPDNAVYERCVESQRVLNSLEKDEKEYNDLKKDIKYLDQRINMSEEFNEHKFNLWFELGSYIVCRFDDDELETKHQKYAKHLFGKFDTYKKLLNIFEQLVADTNNKIVYGSILIMITGLEIDMEHCHLLFFCIKGIQLVDKINASIDSQIIKDELGSIESICNRIKENIDEWGWLIGNDTNKIDNFIEICRNS
jgi:hypothetical protein